MDVIYFSTHGIDIFLSGSPVGEGTEIGVTAFFERLRSDFMDNPNSVGASVNVTLPLNL